MEESYQLPPTGYQPREGKLTVVTTIDDLLAAARARLDRVAADRLAEAVAAGAMLVDIRPAEERERDGDLDGAVVIDRNVMEWRLAPSSDYRIADIPPDQLVIVVCTDGYQSSLAAANLQELGLPGATDLIGGYRSLLRNPTEGG